MNPPGPFQKFSRFLYRVMERLVPGQARQNVLLLSGSTAAGHIIGLLTTPIITRMYSPADYGIFSVYVSLLGTLLVISSLRFNIAIPVQGTERDALAVVLLSFIVTALMTIVLCLVIVFLLPLLLAASGRGLSLWYLGILVISFFCAGGTLVLTYWTIRKKEYSEIAKATLAKGFTGPATKVCIGLFAASPAGLLAGDLVAHVTGFILLLFRFRERLRFEVITLPFTDVLTAAKRNAHYALYTAPGALAGTFAQQLPVFLVLSLYGPDTAGLYAMAVALLAIPLSVITSTILQVFTGEIAPLIISRPSGIRLFYASAVKKMAVISIPVIGIIAVAAPTILPLYLGSLWKEAGIICIPLCLAVLFQMIFQPVSILSYAGFNRWGLALDIVRVVATIATFFAGPVFGFSLITVLLIYSSAMALSHTMGYILNLEAIRRLEMNNHTSIKE